MKVLQVCAYAARYGGNFIACLTALEAALAEQGVETTYLFPETARDMPWCRELQNRAQVYFAGLNRFSPKVFGQIKAAMAHADIIHSHFELYDCFTALARKKHQKLFWHLHDSFDEVIDLPHRIINWFQYGVCGKTVTLLNPNDYYSRFVQAWGFPKEQIIHVDNAVDFSRLKRDNREEMYDFLVFGGFYRIKGLDVLLDACRLLKGKGLSFSLGIVGYPDTWKFIDERYRDLDRHICKLDPSEDVSSFFNSARTFVSASRRETFSYSLLEALYLGCDAVISDIPGTGWANGYPTVTVFPSEDATTLAMVLEEKLLCNGAEDNREPVIRDVTARYNAQNWAERIKEIYFGT